MDKFPKKMNSYSQIYKNKKILSQEKNDSYNSFTCKLINKSLASSIQNSLTNSSIVSNNSNSIKNNNSVNNNELNNIPSNLITSSIANTNKNTSSEKISSIKNNCDTKIETVITEISSPLVEKNIKEESFSILSGSRNNIVMSDENNRFKKQELNINENENQKEENKNLKYKTTKEKTNKKEIKTEIKDKKNISYTKIFTQEEILYYTHIIFLNNSTYNKKNNEYLMPKNNLLSIIKSLNISPEIKIIEMDLLFDSISPKSNLISYNKFYKFLIKTVQKLFPSEYAENAKNILNIFFTNFFNQYDLLLFENKIPKNYLYKYQYNSIVQLLNISPNKNQLFIMNEIIYTLNEIYEKYFIYEFNFISVNKRKNFQNLIKFSKDFEITPLIMNETQLISYYNITVHIEHQNIFNYFFQINEHKFNNKGEEFTLIHFILFIIHVSLYYYAKFFDNNINDKNLKMKSMTNESKLLLFLEKLECSKIMENFNRKLFMPNNSKLSLIPDINIINCFDSFEKNANILDNKNSFAENPFISIVDIINDYYKKLNMHYQKNKKNDLIKLNKTDYFKIELDIIQENKIIIENSQNFFNIFKFFAELNEQKYYMSINNYTCFLHYCDLMNKNINNNDYDSKSLNSNNIRIIFYYLTQTGRNTIYNSQSDYKNLNKITIENNNNNVICDKNEKKEKLTFINFLIGFIIVSHILYKKQNDIDISLNKILTDYIIGTYIFNN